MYVKIIQPLIVGLQYISVVVDHEIHHYIKFLHNRQKFYEKTSQPIFTNN